MATTPKQTTNTQETTTTPKVGAEGVEISKQETQSATKNILEEAERREKEFEGIFKEKNPSKEAVVAHFQRENPEKYKDKSYEDILEILQNGEKGKDGKYDESLKYPELYTRIKRNADKPKTETAKPTPTETASEPQATKTEDIQKTREELQKQLFKPEPAPVEKKEEKQKKTSSRWTEADEAARGGSKPEKKEEKAEKGEESKAKKETHFWKGVGNTILWPFKTLNKIRRTAGRTLMAPTYFLADIGEEKKAGGADLAKGYKEIWTGKKAA